MKLFKRLFIVCVLLGAVCLLLIAVFMFSASLQRSVALAILKDHVDSPEVEYVKLSPSLGGIELTDFSAVKEGVKVKVGSAVILGDFLDAALGRTIHIESIKIKGLEVDASESDLAAASASSSEPAEQNPLQEAQPFEGLFKEAIIPAALYVGAVDIESKVLLANQRVFEGVITGGDIAPGKQSELAIKASFTDGSASAELSTVEATGAIVFDQLSNHSLSEILLTMDLTAVSSHLESNARAQIELLAQAVDEEEMVRLNVVNLTNEQSPITLIQMESRFDSSSGLIEGDYEIQIRDDDVKPFLPNRALPVFTLKGEGRYQSNVQTLEGTLHSELNVSTESWGDYDAALQHLPPLDGVFVVDVDFKETLLTLNALSASLLPRSGGELLAVKLLSPFTLDAENPGNIQDVPTGELVSVRLSNLPIAWVDAFVADYSIVGHSLSAALTLAHEGGVWGVKTGPEGVALDRVSVSHKGQMLLSDISAVLNTELNLVGSQLSAKIQSLKVKSNAAPLIHNTEADIVLNDFPKVKLSAATFKTELNLAQILQQPIAQAYNNTATGDLEIAGKVETSAVGEMNVDLNAELRGLMLKEPMKKINKATFGVTGTIHWPEAVKLTLPIAMVGSSGSSDCVIEATVGEESGRIHFDVSAQGEALHVDDVLLLSKAFKKPLPSHEADSLPPENRETAASLFADEKPVWDGFMGKANVDLKRLVVSGQSLQSVKSRVSVTPKQVNLEQLSADYYGAPIESSALLNFNEGIQIPYNFVADLALENLEIKNVIAKSRSSEAPVTGSFSLKTDLKGKGANLNHLVQQMQGDVLVEGSKGSINPRVNFNEVTQGLSRLAGLTTGAASLIAGLALGEEGTKIQKILQTVTKLTDLLKSIAYDRIVLHAVRGDDLNIVLDEVLLDSPELVVSGQGTVTHQEGVAVLDQPLRVEALIQAKGSVAQLFDNIELLTAGPDENGFYSGPQFVIKGSLGKADYSELKDILLERLKVAEQLKGLFKSGKKSSGDQTTGDNQGEEEPAEKLIRGLGGLLGL